MFQADRIKLYVGPTHSSGAATITAWSLDLANTRYAGALDNRVFDLDLVIIGRSSAAGTGVSGLYRATATRIAGIAAIAGTLQVVQALQGSMAGAFGVAIDTSGTTVRLRITGVALAEVDWYVSGAVTNS
jgi:hypothetical protein